MPKCPFCEKPISSDTTSCPYCGAPISTPPFGFAFELADGKSPTDRIPPGGNGRYVTERGYFD